MRSPSSPLVRRLPDGCFVVVVPPRLLLATAVGLNRLAGWARVRGLPVVVELVELHRALREADEANRLVSGTQPERPESHRVRGSLLSMTETAARAGISRQAATKAARVGRLRAVQVDGDGPWVTTAEAVQEFTRSRSA